MGYQTGIGPDDSRMMEDMSELEAYIRPLLSARQDFSSAFTLVNRLPDVLTTHAEGPLAMVLEACDRVLAEAAYRSQKQAYFLYRAVAQALQRVATGAALDAGPDGRSRSIGVMLKGLDAAHEGLRRAMAEGLGTLPLAVDRRPPPAVEPPRRSLHGTPRLDDAWLATRGVHPLNGWSWCGRSMLAATRTGVVLVVKHLQKGEDPVALGREAAWMTYLRTLAAFCPHRFDIPRPLTHAKGCLVRVPPSRRQPHDGPVLHPRRYALAFLASPAYFHYPNEADPRRRLDHRQLQEVLTRNAWLMGWLMGRGIAHTAPIPLFHNRAQRHRREDGGRYRWTHAGRLDRWLASCRHPNFGVSGLRDFEHFENLAGRPACRYEAIGSQLISLLLVCGSYFRQKAPRRIGWDAAGRPVDARDLFDRDLFGALIKAIFSAYFEGFSGQILPPSDWPAPAPLVDRMIEEMGVDRHMEEVLRVADQDAMDGRTFLAFLASRGMAPRDAARLPKGREDIPLMTGPHLGGFNQPISLPELIAFAAAGAARCVAGRFRMESGALRPGAEGDGSSLRDLPGQRRGQE